MSAASTLKRRLEKLEAAAKAEEDQKIPLEIVFSEYGREPEPLGRDLVPGERLVTDETRDGSFIVREVERATTDPSDCGMIFDRDGHKIGRYVEPSDRLSRLCEIEEEYDACLAPTT